MQGGWSADFIFKEQPPESAHMHNAFQREGGVHCVVIETAF